MRHFILFCAVTVLCGCSNDEGPVEPRTASTEYTTPKDPGPPATAYSFDFTGYGETLEPGYSKTFSDGSWNKYVGMETVGGKTYKVVDADNGSRYYYTLTSGQYAGYRPPNDATVMFDAPEAQLPAGWNLKATVVSSVSFTYQGYSVSAKKSYTLIDTLRTVTVLGSFSPVAHFMLRLDLTASSGDASTTLEDVWVARGPGGIKFQIAGKTAAEFSYGYVNGTSWGTQPGVHKGIGRPFAAAGALLQGGFR